MPTEDNRITCPSCDSENATLESTTNGGTNTTCPDCGYEINDGTPDSDD